MRISGKTLNQLRPVLTKALQDGAEVSFMYHDKRRSGPLKDFGWGPAGPFITIEHRKYIDGVAAPGGFIFGSYLHGLFDNSNFRHAFLSGLRRRKGLPIIPEPSAISQEQQFDALADVVRQNLNMALVYQICELKR